MRPFTRWEKINNHCICYLCLQPKYVCKSRVCTVGSKVPGKLVCHGCAKVAKKKGWSPLSILFCKRKAYADSRVDYKELRKVLEK